MSPRQNQKGGDGSTNVHAELVILNQGPSLPEGSEKGIKMNQESGEDSQSLLDGRDLTNKPGADE
ncbi:MAG: hypothetical protein Q8L08_02310 [Candidatus Nanopelagicaceae bacterium]|nr:hypothetical protein [Candidatus Nanopelagicaceae bacterium]